MLKNCELFAFWWFFSDFRKNHGSATREKQKMAYFAWEGEIKKAAES